MTTLHENQVFLRWIDRDSGLSFKDMLFRGCTFDNCCLSRTKEIALRSTVQNAQILGCKTMNCSVGPGIFEDVLVDGLETNDTLLFWAPVFRHVEVRGKVGKIKINPVPHFSDNSPALLESFLNARQAFYASVDWALDIREAIFNEFNVLGVPPRLVRRDPETQAIARRSQIAKDGWQAAVSPWNTYWPFVLKMYLSEPEDKFLLVVPKGKKRKEFSKLLDGLNELRRLGVVEAN